MIRNNMYLEELSKCVDELPFLDKLDNQTVFITGAAGLIGTYLVDIIMYYNQYKNGKINVIALDYNEELLKDRFSIYDGLISTVVGDVNDINIINGLLKEDIDYIIHAASNTSPIDYAKDPVGTITTNVIGTHNLLQFSIKNKVKRFLFCSSVEMYGANNGDVEDFIEEYSGYVNCNTVRASYPSGKRAAESMCCAYKNQYGLDYTIARIGRIYGHTVIEGDTKAPTQFIMNAVNNEDIVLKSDGMQFYSYCYVGDCATALLTILINGISGEAYNVADPYSKVHLRDFASIAAKAVGTNCSFKMPDEDEKAGYSKICKATMDVSKLMSIEWKPIMSIEQGIFNTIKYLKEGKSGNEEI